MAPQAGDPAPTPESIMDRLQRLTPEDIAALYATTKLDPRPYQHRIVAKTLKGYSQGKRSILIESATGSGKTSVALVCCKALQGIVPDLGIAWVSMRRNLLAQAVKENVEKNINVQNIHFVSMFAKQLPPEFMAHKNKLVVVDECLVGETLVHALVDGRPALVPISEIVESGVGTHALSYDESADVLEWMPITTRAATGTKEVFEVEIEADDGQMVVLTVSANHRFLGDDGYHRLDELAVGDTVFVKHHAGEPATPQEWQHERSSESQSLPTAALS